MSKYGIFMRLLMMFFLLAIAFFSFSSEKLLFAPNVSFEVACNNGTIKEHILNAQNPENHDKYKDHLEFFMWATPSTRTNCLLLRYKDKRDNYGVISKYKIAYKRGFHLIENNKFSVFQFEPEESAPLKTFVILNFTSNDSAHVNHLMDFLNVHRN